MSDSVYGHVIGAEKLTILMNGLGERFREEIRTSTKTIGETLAAYIQKKKLSGQVLKNRSGNLRTSVHFGDITETPNGITGTVGTIREYAAAHEYGGPYQVKEHLRMQTMAWGRPMTPKQVTVKEFTMNMPQRSFLRSALRETKNLIAAEYERAAKRAIAGMLK